ncbi:hypothetical protein NPX13_g11354 [Xylaria arbuscula]|uniref:Uncharacterized protein n=1 Tax=Xylaria arbuscula TaxID=114810 RepID=A0A9W8N2X4_9PEZI|nr:hypothetical protein NPX13_g11354 [Xylaria arbuscula]
MFRLILGCILWASGAVGYTLPDACTIFSHTQTGCNPIVPASFLPASIQSAPKTKARSGHTDENSIFADLVEALNVTQAEFFAPWLGTWPEAIDWTAAVIGTHVSGVARSISEDLVFLDSKERNAVDWRDASNLIDKYFTQLVAYYFGQDAFAIRNEAYDDILWVVLGWLETIKLVNTHNNLYYTHAAEDETGTTPPVKDGIYGSSPGIMNQLYHGTTWLSTFSHRARVFWDLASPGRRQRVAVLDPVPRQLQPHGPGRQHLQRQPRRQVSQGRRGGLQVAAQLEHDERARLVRGRVPHHRVRRGKQ